MPAPKFTSRSHGTLVAGWSARRGAYMRKYEDVVAVALRAEIAP
jgi:hypothetical protein